MTATFAGLTSTPHDLLQGIRVGDSHNARGHKAHNATRVSMAHLLHAPSITMGIAERPEIFVVLKQQIACPKVHDAPVHGVQRQSDDIQMFTHISRCQEAAAI